MAEHTITVEAFALTVDGTVANGAIVADLTPSAIISEAGAMTLTAVQTFGPFSLGFAAGGGVPDYVGWRPGFAGTITSVCVVTSVSPDGAVTITPTIAGGATTPAAIVVPMTDPVGTVQDVPITAGGAFTADQLIRFVATTGGLGGFVSVLVTYTRS